MAKPLPVPTAPPSPRATKIIRDLRALIDTQPADADDYVQRVVDVVHILAASRAPIIRLMADAQAHGGSYNRQATALGLSRSAVQRRVERGRDETTD